MSRAAHAVLLALLLVLLVVAAQPSLAQDPSAPTEGEKSKDGNLFLEALKAFFDWLLGQLGDIGKTIVDALSKVGGLLKNAWDFFSSVFGAVSDFFGLLAKGIDFVRKLVGSAGDPALYVYVHSRLAFQACCSTDIRARELAADALANCSRYRLSDVSWLVDPRLAEDGRTLCEIAPSGFLGMVSVFLAGAQALGGFVSWFFQNFLIVHGLAFGGTLMWAASTSFTRRSLQPLERWAEWWGRYIRLYVRFFKWLLEKLWELVQIIAELLPL